MIGRGGPQGCETLRRLYFLEKRLTDGGVCQPYVPLPPGENQFAVKINNNKYTLCPHENSYYSFLLEPESTPGQ
jgi:hypothetical protein